MLRNMLSGHVLVQLYDRQVEKTGDPGPSLSTSRVRRWNIVQVCVETCRSCASRRSVNVDVEGFIFCHKKMTFTN